MDHICKLNMHSSAFNIYSFFKVFDKCTRCNNDSFTMHEKLLAIAVISVILSNLVADNVAEILKSV